MFLIDIGNSRIKWAVGDSESLSFHGEAEYVAKELDAQFDVMWRDIAKPDHVVVASVAAPKVVKALGVWLESRWQMTYTQIKPEAQTDGLLNGYLEPERLGVDRWLALLAVMIEEQPETPFCVIDCGSAITIDAVNAKGEHVGGLIVPGISMMRNALVKGTSGIRLKDKLPAEVSILARDTEGAVIGGSLYSAVAMIDRVCDDILAMLGSSTQFFMTGGDAAELIPLLDHEFAYDAHLVLHGLAIAAKIELGDSTALACEDGTSQPDG